MSDYTEMQLGRAVETRETRARLRQDLVWVDVDGVEHEVASMSRRHAAAVVRFLERRARWIHDGECAEAMFMPAPRGEYASDAWDDEFAELLASKPLEWLRARPLMRALTARAAGVQPRASWGWRLRHPLVAVGLAPYLGPRVTR